MTDMHKLTGAYALDAVDDIERARFEQHLAECDDCRAEVAELRETAALLTEATAVEAPASLRTSVLAGISQVRPLPPEVPPTVTPIDIRSQRSAGRRAWMPFLVAAALALVVGIGAAVMQPWGNPGNPDNVSDLSAAEQVLGAPDAEQVFVDLGESGRATVVRSKAENRAVIETEDMVAAPAGKVYELWLMTPQGKFVPAGLMPDRADQTIVLEGAAADARAVGITIEPDGGSARPTTDPIAIFDLTEAT